MILPIAWKDGSLTRHAIIVYCLALPPRYASETTQPVNHQEKGKYRSLIAGESNVQLSWNLPQMSRRGHLFIEKKLALQNASGVAGAHQAMIGRINMHHVDGASVIDHEYVRVVLRQFGSRQHGLRITSQARPHMKWERSRVSALLIYHQQAIHGDIIIEPLGAWTCDGDSHLSGQKTILRAAWHLG